MGRREKPRAKSIIDDNDDEELNTRINRTVFTDSDDEAANEDLTLKIIEKAMSRTSQGSATAAVDGGEVVVEVDDGVTKKTKKKDKIVNQGSNRTAAVDGGEVEKKKKDEKVKKKKVKKEKVVEEEGVDTEVIQSLPIDKAEELEELVVNSSEPNVDENSNSDNVVLRRLLCGPRYFDPPDKSWGACFNCGEEGHSAVNCTSARRKRPCFICGSLEHEVKQCQKGQDCFICKGQGHRAKDCPQKMKRHSVASECCLKCGASAHAMFSCNNDYSPDDLKDIQCYVCKKFGHLCCANYFDDLGSEVSCYKCGHTGHHGQDCRGSKGETSNGGVSNGGGTPGSCFKCGEEGHFARECKTSVKPKKRTRDSSTPAGKKYPNDKKGSNYKGYNSAPHDFGKPRRRKLHLDEGSPNWSSKPPKRRGGWIPDDQDDYPRRNYNWRTPNKNHRIFDLTSGGQVSSPHFFRNNSNYSPGSSNFQGYDSSYDHRYTASRFGHSNGPRRNNDWW